jgi:subtilase family serine protease
MTMPDTGCLSENEQNTVNMKIFNLGDQDAQNFWTHLYKDGSLYYRYWVDQLPAGDSLQIDTVISFSSTGSHSVTGIVDAGDSVSEYNEGNNISTINPYVSCGAPDIAIINVVFSDHILKGEKPIDITAWITNLGSVAVTEPFGVEFSDNGIPFDTQYISSLAPCGLQTVYVVSDSFIYSDTLPHSFKVFADFGNIVTECNEENNIYLSSISAWPDLWPRNLEFSRDCFTWGDSLWFQVDIYNVGEVKAESVWVRFLLDEVPIGGDVLIDSIPSGFGNYETRLSEEPWIVPEELDVTHVCRVVVDPDNEIPEIREDNNELTRATPVVRCGDITRDCVVDIGDIIYMINYLYKNGPTPRPLPAGDVNSDQVVDIGDVVYLINYLFKGGPAPVC